MVTETEGTTKEDMVGEHYLLEKRKEIDRGRMKYKEDMGKTSRKRRNNEDIPMIGRPSKKRKFVPIWRGWGENDNKGEKGLDVECGAGPLDRSNVANDQELITISSGGNMNEGNTDHTVGASIKGEQLINWHKISEDGTGPLVGTSNNEEDGLLTNMRGETNQNMKKNSTIYNSIHN